MYEQNFEYFATENINDYTNFERVFAMIASILPTPCYQDDINCQLIILECLK